MNPKKRDKQFTAILRETQSEIRSYVAGFGVSVFEIDDLSQETYLRYYNDFEKKPLKVADIRWLKGIAKNVVLSHFKQQKQKRNLSDKLIKLWSRVSQVYHEKHSDTSQSDQVKLKECLKKVSEKHQLILESKYTDRVENKQIGLENNLSTAAVGMLLLRIRKSLYLCIKRLQI